MSRFVALSASLALAGVQGLKMEPPMADARNQASKELQKSTKQQFKTALKEKIRNEFNELYENKMDYCKELCEYFQLSEKWGLKTINKKLKSYLCHMQGKLPLRGAGSRVGGYSEYLKFMENIEKKKIKKEDKEAKKLALLSYHKNNIKIELLDCELEAARDAKQAKVLRDFQSIEARQEFKLDELFKFWNRQWKEADRLFKADEANLEELSGDEWKSAVKDLHRKWEARKFCKDVQDMYMRARNKVIMRAKDLITLK